MKSGAVTNVMLTVVLVVAVLCELFPALPAWASFFAVVQTNNWNTCFFNNPLTSGLFLRAERKQLDRSTVKSPIPVAELSIEDYSYENLRIASDNWREPVIVRNWAKDTRAIQSWSPEYVRERLGQYDVVVYQNATLGKDHELNCDAPWTRNAVWTQLEKLGDAISEIETGESLKTIVIPPASRVKRAFNASAQADYMSLVRELELEKLGGPWTNKGVDYSTLVQFWAGYGVESGTHGTGWHADICNNFIVQTAGTKNWTFVHPDDSKFMRPTMKQGKTAISGMDASVLRDNMPYLDKKFVTIRPGDMMYNPDWYWHQIKNNPGYTSAVVARECNLTNSFAANPVFTSMVAVNHARAAVFGGDDYALARLKALIPGLRQSINV